jgi:hypothetical protein
MIIAVITITLPNAPPTIGPIDECEEPTDPLPLEGAAAEGVDVAVPAPEADRATTEGEVPFTAA